MAEVTRDSNEGPSEETEDLDLLEQVDRGTLQQVTNLLDILESESAKTDIELVGQDMRKTLASAIITEKANSEPSMVMNVLICCLKMPEISTERKINIYSILQEIIQQEGELDEHCVQRLVTIASKEMREIQEMDGNLKAEVASDTLVALSGNHFSLVMYELQHHLKPLELTDEFVIVTLAKLANGNVFEFMPYMGITLATIFTMLRLANKTKIRQAICVAMETFCEVVQFYLRHLEDSVYPVMTEEQFAAKLFPMYRYFMTVWLKDNNPEVKLGVIKSLKPMLNLLLPNNDLREQVYDYIPLLLAEYQSSVEALFITQILRQILEVSVTTHTPIPHMQLHTVFMELHVQVCSDAPSQQYSNQNLIEIVHCFVALARSYPRELMKFFLNQMEINNEASRVATLTMIRAVVGAEEPRVSMRTICLAIRVVKNHLSDPRSKVRMAILQIIGQLALSGYQDKIKGWGLKYVSVQLTLSTYKLTNCRESFYVKDLEEKMVHKVTMDTVKIITSSVRGMSNEFWVRLLCYIMETDYTEALTAICISLTNLAEHQLRNKDVEANMTSSSRHVDLPAPQKLLARLLVLISSPYKGEDRGIAILNLLWTLSQSIAPAMTDVWKLEIPLLIQYLKEHTEYTWNKKTWEDKLIQFLKNSLKKTRRSNWSLRLSKELNNQMDDFSSPSPEKAFLYRALGCSLAMGLEADKVEVLLLELLYKTDYSNTFEREGISLSFGMCARGQVKTVLAVLQEFEDKIQESELSWQIGAWRKDHPWRRETMKSALMDMYSFVASYCHPQMLLTHVNNPITTKIIHHYTSSCQDISLKLAFMRSIMQVASAIKSVESLEDFEFAPKATVTGIIMAVIKAEPAQSLASPVRIKALEALIHLSKLKPLYSVEETNELMGIGVHAVISLTPPRQDDDSIVMLHADAMRTLSQLMEALMQRQMDPKGLQEMVQLLEKWILSEKEWEREKALSLFLHMMQIYVQSTGVCIPLKLGQFGTLVGLIAPHICDSHLRTRIASIDVLSRLLDLHASQTCSLWDVAKEKELLRCKEDLSGCEEKVFGASTRIAKVVCTEFTCDEVVSLIRKLCENMGAMDLQHDKASVSWIGVFLQTWVKELEDKVAEILGAILTQLPVVDDLEVRHLLIEGILLLAHYHQDTVLTSLLRQPLPMESHLTEVWLAVAENAPFARTMLHSLMGRLQARFSPRANPTSKADVWRLATVDPLMILCVTHLLLDKVDVDDHLPDLICTLLLQLSTSHWPEDGAPVLKTWRLVHSDTLPQDMNLQRVTIKSMQLVLKRVRSQGLERGLEEQGVWVLLEDGATFLKGVGLFTRLCSRNLRGPFLQRLAELVLRAMNSNVLSCRVCSTAVCVEFMRSPVLHRERLLKPAVLLLEQGVDHEDEALRVLSLRALGNMAIGAPKKVRQYRTLLLEKFLSSLQDPTSTKVASEGMTALTKVLAELREGDVGSSFDAISEQCRTFFNNESEVLRLKAFLLFGKLAKVVWMTKRHLFKAEVKKAWVALMLHCQDPCDRTASVCMETMSQCLHFWGCKGLETPHVQSTASADEMALFQTAMCTFLTQKKPAVLYTFLLETIGYMRNSLSRIRIAACNLAGVILKQMAVSYLKKLDFVELQSLFQELQLDAEPEVRRAALDALRVLDSCTQHKLLVAPEGVPSGPTHC
ncbi:PREDICTED: maestro heat-like repeat-containing protein family member 2A [Elephantulus edwardii]|uniref:maestro heat-like repeat-containing protein family member 2A n=1 Tax=Elephantulus edwardii TaxID=28737 RepID=UPI0003F0AC87|nr:PREDICTED: maestro heat-like repeat-containing protein family member 2A [Elephantulus edwardii]